MNTAKKLLVKEVKKLRNSISFCKREVELYKEEFYRFKLIAEESQNY